MTNKILISVLFAISVSSSYMVYKSMTRDVNIISNIYSCPDFEYFHTKEINGNIYFIGKVWNDTIKNKKFN